MRGPHRLSAEESVDLYPGLVVYEDRMLGQITLGQRRLPLSEILTIEPFATREELLSFQRHLLGHQGEFARLLLTLAEARRKESRRSGCPWWETRTHRQAVGKQLIRCLDRIAPIE